MKDLRWHADGSGGLSGSSGSRDWIGSGGSTDEALAAHAADVLGAGSVALGRLCPTCGSTTHGAPWLRHQGRQVPVSLSRAGGHLVTVIAERPVGVDIEVVSSVAVRWDPSLVLAQGEVAQFADDQALAWTCKEALLKARGVGLTVPMSSVRLAGADVERIFTPPGLVGALAFA